MLLIAATSRACLVRLTPAGFPTYSTASPFERLSTPWNRAGRKPPLHRQAAIGWAWPKRPAELSTTKPGGSSVSAPRPYNHRAWALGAPLIEVPEFMNE